MITAATGAIALVIAPVAREYGMDYFIATVLLGGLIQIVLALLGVAKLMRFIPRSVMVGFVNALAILIFTSQFPQLIGVPWLVYPLVAVGLLVMYLMPRITKVIPAPLVAIVLLTAAVVVFAWNVPNVGDQENFPRACRRCSFRMCRSPSRRCRSSLPTRWLWPWSACSSRS